MASLKYCRNELQSIINELESISSGIRSSFKGLGQDKCADSLDVIISKYRYVLRKLNNVDTNRVADFINSEE